MELNDKTKVKVDVYTFAPLLNFHTDASEIKLADGYVICPPTDAELKILKEPQIGWSPDLWLSLFFIIRSGIHKAIRTEIISTDKVKRYLFDTRPLGQLADIRNAMRIFKCGEIECNPLYMVRIETSKVVMVSTSAGRPLPCSQSDIYILSTQDVPLFSAFYDEYRAFDFNKHPERKIAIQRFSLSYEVGWLYQPIDLMVSFEALYLGEEMELAYKLALRAAYLLGKTAQERLQICRILRKAYSIRSKLVHGEKYPSEVEIEKGKPIRLDEFLNMVENILRESIKRFMSLVSKYSHKQLLETVLDDNVISGGTLLSGTAT
jgi:hypothetical protein